MCTKCQSNEGRDSNGKCVPTPEPYPTGQGRDPDTRQCVPTLEHNGSVTQPDCNDPANKGLAACKAGAGTDTGTGTLGGSSGGGSGGD